MNKKIAIISAAFMLAAPIVPVFAQVSDLATKPGLEKREQVRGQVNERRLAEEATLDTAQQTKRELAAQKRLEFQDRKEKMAADRCQNIEQKIANRENRYENNGQMLQKVYGNMKTRLTRLSGQLKAGGADTTKLDADLVMLYAKIDKLFADQSNFMTTLKASQTAACGSTEGEFKAQLENARKVPELIKQDRTDIRLFFQETIKADLQAIMVKLGGTLETDEPKNIQTTENTKVKVNKRERDEDQAGVYPTSAPAATVQTVQ